MKIFGKHIAVLIILVQSVCAQITLVKEEIVGGKYRLVYSNDGYFYSVKENNGKRYLSFSGTDDEKEKQSFPAQNLIIALPPNSRPAVTVKVTKQQQLPSETIGNLPATEKELYTVQGYFWIDNSYCVRIIVHPFYYDKTSGQAAEIKEFYVDIALSQSIAADRSQINLSTSMVIDNPKFGSQWKSQQPSYSIAQIDSWIDYNVDYVKLGVANDGIYRLRYEDLLSFGIPVGSLNPKSIKIYLMGKEIPIYVYGENDNTFNQGDYVEFLGRRNYGDVRYREAAPFGSPYYEYMNPYSDTTIYWLNWSGSFGQRVDTTVTVSGISTDTLQYYDELIHSERNNYWDFSLAGGDLRRNDPAILENETWNEGNLGVGQISVSFSVSDLYPAKPARAFVKLQDYASSIQTEAHNLALSINNTATTYDAGFIDKYQVKVLKAEFSSSELSNGSNTVDIHSYATANSINTVIRDWYELEYPRNLKTTTDSILFAYNNIVSPMVAVLSITGLSGNTFSLYKFTLNDSSTAKITNYTRSVDTLRFIDIVANGTYYFLLREDKIPAPIFFYKKKFANLRNASNQADYLAITHPYFQSAASNYVSFITSTYGVAAKLIDVFDIYDEFNYGFFAPEPIKEFLKSTHTYWQTPKPKYVVLIGKGTYDFYENKTHYFGAPPTPNFVPPYGNPVSDIWFVLWDSTGSLVPQMNIGRIPAKDNDEFQSYAVKHQKYVTKGYDDWNKRYLFFAGGNFTDTNQIAQCKGVNDFIINNYVSTPPIGGLVANFYKTANPITNFGPYSPEYIKDAIDQGGVFISYIGHSGTQTWDNNISDVSQLANVRDRNPMITDFGCSTAKFAEPDVLSFSELAVNGLQGQAISYIGNSSAGFTSTAFDFPKYFYKKLLVDTSASLGDVHRLAKIDYIKQRGTSDSYGIFIKTNTLIGDPIVKLPIPTKPNYSFSNTIITVIPQRPTEQMDSVILSLNYFNMGAVVGDSVEFLVTNSFQGSTILSHTEKRSVPLFSDSFFITIPVKGKPGEHTVTITADPLNSIDEIYENDNSIVYHLFVASSSIRNMSLTTISNQTKGDILFLNPSILPPQSQFTVDVSLQQSFGQSQSYTVPFDTFYTRFLLDTTYKGKRIWVRPKFANTNYEGLTYSYYDGEKDNYLLNDSNSFSVISNSRLKILQNTLALDTSRIVFSTLSAGFNDGRTVVISRNGQNYVPENTLRGHHVCLFNATSLEFISYYRFDIYAGTAIADAYKTLIDTLTSDYIVAIAISDEGSQNLSAELKASIKTLGSMYVDSIVFRGSWAIIGRKGALPGSVPENYSSPFQGRVTIDTTIIIPNTNGVFETETLGPVAEWKNVGMKFKENYPDNIGLKVVGVSIDNSLDTLIRWSVIDSVLDISTINAQHYPFIKLIGELQRGVGEPSPSVSSVEVNYTSLPELGINYQTVKATLKKDGTLINANDSVMQGEKIDLAIRVYNAGGSTAKNVGIQLQSLWENGVVEPVLTASIDSIAPLSYKEISATYNNSLGFGKRSFRITIDRDTSIKELYKDNNDFVFPIIVKKSESSVLLPNLYMVQNGVQLQGTSITNKQDSVPVKIVYGNSGALINDSITISIKQYYLGGNITSWIIRRKYPVSFDTLSIDVPVLNKAGEHQIQVELDPLGLITESSETDNVLNYYFIVKTTDFRIMQPTEFSTSYFPEIIFLNPTEAEGDSDRTAEFQIDSIADYSKSVPSLLPMDEFTTSHTISSLKHPRRYYWRIRQHKSSNEWTTGTFYLGDSIGFTFGQSDSVGWSSNMFTHSAFLSNGGAQIVDTKFSIKATSSGFNDGHNGSIEVNGTNLISPIFGEGHNVVVLDTNGYSVVMQRRFDIPNNLDESDSLTTFVNTLSSGLVVIDVIVDDGSNNLKQSTRDALKTIGSSQIDKVSFRDSWAIIGRKGAAIGSVPEQYKPQGTGPAMAETVIVRKEYSAVIVTPSFGPLVIRSQLSMVRNVPSGTSLQATLVGTKVGSTDTMSLGNFPIADVSSATNVKYNAANIIFSLYTSNQSTPSIESWKLSSVQPTELAVSSRSTSIDRTEVFEGEPIDFSGTIYNVSGVQADSVTVALLTNEGGTDKVLKSESLVHISPHDSVLFSYTYDSKSKRGNHAFIFEIDPADNILEHTKDNNRITIPYHVIADTIRPHVDITFDGVHIYDGDYTLSNPTIQIKIYDNSPLSLLNPSSVSVNIDERHISLGASPDSLFETKTGLEKALVIVRPTLSQGSHTLTLQVEDAAGNYADTAALQLHFKVETESKLLNVINYPNPFGTETFFTFIITGSKLPDEATIKIYSITGRLIQELKLLQGSLLPGFNRILWDGKDRDGDDIANGIYFYKVIAKTNGSAIEVIQKLAKVR